MGVGKYPDAFTALDEQVHSSRRKIVNNLYSMSNIVRSEESIDVCTSMLMTKMEEFARRGDVIDLAKWSQMYDIFSLTLPRIRVDH